MQLSSVGRYVANGSATTYKPSSVVTKFDRPQRTTIASNSSDKVDFKATYSKTADLSTVPSSYKAVDLIG
jgi:hypothetical protein